MWYYIRGDDKVGPVDEAEMREQIRFGTVDPSTPVWREGMGDWKEAGTTELFSDIGAGTEPPPFAPAPMKSQGDDTTLAVIAHVLGILAGFLGPLILFLVATDPGAKEHAKEALNWQISLVIYMTVSAVLSLVIIGFFAMMALAIMNIVFCIIAAIKAGNRDFYRYPITIRFVS